MTRGTIHLITEHAITRTCQFNGGMYLSGHGYKVIDILEETDQLEKFKKLITQFSKDNHDYEDGDELYTSNFTANEITLKSGEEPGDPTLADYTYWKNLSGRTITFLDRDSNKLILEHNSIAIFNFCKRYGKFYCDPF